MFVHSLVLVEPLRFGSDRSVVIATYLRYRRIRCVVRRWRGRRFDLLLHDRKRSTLIVVSVSHVLVEKIKEVLVQGRTRKV